jgi:peroxiredoxin
VVFAAGWCSHCTEELPKIAAYYPTLKEKNVEVILVSLDENASDFAKFAAPFPFISTTDYKKWEGQAALDYQVYATPSYFLLDKDLKIVKRLNSVEHLKAMVDML